MKQIILGMMLLVMAGCGDTINQAPPVSSSLQLPIVQGAADFIPSNFQCTTQMNKVFAEKGTPLSMPVGDAPYSMHNATWRYADMEYYFGWYADAAICKFESYSLNPPGVITGPNITTAGAASYITSNTYCTQAMNDAFAKYGKPAIVSMSEFSDPSFRNQDSWQYPNQNLILNFGWYSNIAICDVNTVATIMPKPVP